MSLIIPNSGEIALLDKMLQAALSVDESYILKLYQSNFTITQTTAAADLDAVEANFTGYAAQTLTRAGWGGSAMVSGVASSAYATVQAWTCGTSGNTIYGYYVLGATSGSLLWVEAFPTSRSMGNTDILNLTPVFTFTHS